MTLDEAIARLTELREAVGGDAPLCIESEQTPSGRVNVFRLATIEAYNVLPVDTGNNHKHWVCLMNGNTSQIVVVS